MALALEADVSTRHLSFVETGRSVPSRDLVVRLAKQLELPMREQNRLLFAAGYAPAYAETAMESPHMKAIREAIGQILASHEPYPATVLDRDWNVVDMNAGVEVFTDGVAPELLERPNVMRVCLHPSGLAPRIVNLAEFRPRLLRRLRRQLAVAPDSELEALYGELIQYGPAEAPPEFDSVPSDDVVWPLRIRYGDQELAFFTTISTFGTPLDITVAELTIELFFPADAATASFFRTVPRAKQDRSIDRAER